MDDLIKALQILKKYGNPDFPTHCEHDVLTINPDINPDDVSESDKAELQELGFDIGDPLDIGVNGFYSYTFGSA